METPTLPSPARIPSPLKLLACVLAVSLATAQAEPTPQPERESDWNITAECQMIIVPQKFALPLLPALLDPAKIEATHAKLMTLVGIGEAQLAANLIAKTSDKERTVVESIEEVRYATEFNPPHLPQNAPDNPEVLKHWPVAGVTPVAFETRNIGATLEMNPWVEAGGKRIQISLVPQHVRFLRWAKTDAGKLANGERLVVEQPIFHTMKTSTLLRIKNGERVLLGVHKVPEASDSLELFLIRVEAVPAPPK